MSRHPSSAEDALLARPIACLAISPDNAVAQMGRHERWIRLPHAVAASSVLLACGARSELRVDEREGTHPGAGGGASSGSEACSHAPPSPSAPCVGWQPGSAQLIAGAPPTNVGLALGVATASDCGVLTAWSRFDSAGAGTVSWSTRFIDFDGAPLAPPIAHPSLTVSSQGSASMSLAANGNAIGALEADETGCHFLGLDSEGHETGAFADLGTNLCGAIAASGNRWSFLEWIAAASAVTLDVLDPATGQATKTPLPVPSGQVIWDRLVFPDGSFLLDTFREDPMSNLDTDWLEPFSAAGAPLGPQIAVSGPTTAPVWLAPAGAGALAGWSAGSIAVLAIDRNGVATGLVQAVTSSASVYEMTLLPAPDGDVLLVWIQLEPNDNLSLHAQALSPDGSPRGPSTLLAPEVDSNRVYGAVESSGGRAVLVLQRNDGIVALPLTCERGP